MRNDLNRHSVTALEGARDMAHKAVQLVTKAARANLPAAPDDSHSNLGWNPHGGVFYSQPLPLDVGAESYVGLDVNRLTLALAIGSEMKGSFDLTGCSQSEAENWLDKQLQELGLKPASTVALPYELPASANAITQYTTDGFSDALATLSAWFALAHKTLSTFADAHQKLHPGPSPVRCWPHHFDIATYVSLEVGDFETARGIGVGMSPGDESYDQPYFYINPWPHTKMDDLPELPAPGHWHTKGFVGAIAMAEEVISLDNIASQLAEFVNGAFSIGRKALGA